MRAALGSLWGRVAVVLCGVVAIVATAEATGSLATTLEVAAVSAVLIGVAVAFGALDRSGRPRRDVDQVDERTTTLATAGIESLDRIEHRRIELGGPWPQLLIGPTGVALVDVCEIEGPLVVDGAGVHGRDDRRPCNRCVSAVRASEVARRELTAAAQSVPVRTVVAVAPGTVVTVRVDAGHDVIVVPADELADVLTRGPVLPMDRVDAAFALMTRTVTAASVAAEG